MGKVWLNGGLVDHEDAKVSVYDKGVLYGDGVFEGIRAYNGRIFKLASHLKRMYRSAEKIFLEPKYSIEQIDAAVRETVAASGLSDAYIRLVFTRGVGTLGLDPFKPHEQTAFCIVDRIRLFPEELYENGLPVIVAKRPRIPIASLDPSIKSCNYLNNILAKVEARQHGVAEAIMLNPAGFVSEGTGDNIFMVNDGVIVTPPTEAGILHGVTRQFVIDTVAPACNARVEQKMLHLDDLLNADEVFLTGTAAEIIGVNRIDDHTIGCGGVGQVTGALMTEFRNRVRENAPED